MTKREPRSVRLDPEVWSEFVDQVVEWEGQKRGELGRHVENALLEYVDRDRLARIEDKLDTLLEDTGDAHTHTARTAGERAESIAARIAEGGTVIPDDDVVRAIEAAAGSDPRTIDKYRSQLKRRGLAYHHPTDSVWTVDRSVWLGWAEDHIDNNPTAQVADITDPYPMSIEEYDREVTTINA